MVVYTPPRAGVGACEFYIGDLYDECPRTPSNWGDDYCGKGEMPVMSFSDGQIIICGNGHGDPPGEAGCEERSDHSAMEAMDADLVNVDPISAKLENAELAQAELGNAEGGMSVPEGVELETELGQAMPPEAMSTRFEQANYSTMGQKHDWKCPSCGDHQFAKNTMCRKCGEPKPALVPRAKASSWEGSAQGRVDLDASWGRIRPDAGMNHRSRARQRAADRRERSPGTAQSVMKDRGFSACGTGSGGGPGQASASEANNTRFEQVMAAARLRLETGAD